MSTVKPLTLDSLNISCLNEEERSRLLQVLERNNKLVNNENVRLSRMDTEIKGELKTYASKQSKLTKNECLNCSTDLKDFDGCEKCQKKVCLKCCQSYGTQNVMLCKVCYREMLLEAKRAKWFYDNIPQSLKTDEVTPQVSQPEERRTQIVTASEDAEYKVMIDRIADKLHEIDVESNNLSKSRFGPKKTFAQTPNSQQKDKLKRASLTETENKENQIAMNKLVEKIIEYNEQFKIQKN